MIHFKTTSARIFGVYIGINQNLSKLVKLIGLLFAISWCTLILATHSASTSLLSFVLPLIGISIRERLRDRGNDIRVCSDDPSKQDRAELLLSTLFFYFSQNGFNWSAQLIHVSFAETKRWFDLERFIMTTVAARQDKVFF